MHIVYSEDDMYLLNTGEYITSELYIGLKSLELYNNENIVILENGFWYF